MPSLNVYIPEELKERMSGHDLNWSKIAATAIQTAIEIQELSTVNVQEASLTRLRGQRATATEKRRAEGVRIGAEWATAEDVTYEDLEEIAALREREFESAEEALAAVVEAIYGEGNWYSGQQFAENFLEVKSGSLPSLELVEGFVEGVCQVFDQV